MNDTAATQKVDTRIAQRWAVDPLEVGCPFNVDTEASDPVCIVNEDAPGKDRKERNANRHAIAQRIVAEHNALLGIPEPAEALRLAKESMASMLRYIQGLPAKHHPDPSTGAMQKWRAALAALEGKP